MTNKAKHHTWARLDGQHGIVPSVVILLSLASA
jgi:hypothetical protein